jgi:hypothetical protein
MAEKEKTIVDYLHQQLLLAFGDELKDLRGLFVIAKEVEEKQLKDAWNNGVLAKTFEKTFSQYYNEKYEK